MTRSSEDSEKIVFYKHHGFIGDSSNVIESTYDLLAILEYCQSDKMNYTEETKKEIRKFIDYLNKAANKGELTYASNLP